MTGSVGIGVADPMQLRIPFASQPTASTMIDRTTLSVPAWLATFSLAFPDELEVSAFHTPMVRLATSKMRL
jgi:hypothetical protein